MNPHAQNANRTIEAEPLLAQEERDLLFDVANDNSETLTVPYPEREQIRGANRVRHGLARFPLQQRTTIVALLTVIMFMVTASGMLFLVPVVRLMEDAICHIHYGKDRSEPIEERLCKVEAVQSELAFLGGVAAVLNAVVGLVATLPYGVVADRIGRKPSFLLAYVGIVLAFAWGPLMLVVGETPYVRIAMLGSLFFLIGGGIPVAMNTLHAMASDISSDGDRATAFLRLSFGAVSGGLLGPVAAGLLMEHLGPWIPVLLVLCASPVVCGMALFLPETLPAKQIAPEEDEQRRFGQRLRGDVNELGVSLALLRDPNLIITLPAFLIQPALFAAYSSTLAQHVSTYFGWTLAQTTYLLSPLGILQLVVIVLLPVISRWLTNDSGRFRLSTFSKDVLLTKLSLLFLLAGALIEGFSQQIALFLVGLAIGTLGSCHGPLCRAIATSYVEPRQTSRLYALISLLETGGALLGGPVLAWCFSVGLSRRGVWTGLPWFYVAALVLAALLPLPLLEEPKEKAAGAGMGESVDLRYQSAEQQV